MEASMADITAALVKELRDKSGVGMMDCKKALQENNGDLEASMDWLRAKGLSKAAKQADPIAGTKLASGETVQDMGTQLIATVGENMMLRRAAAFAVQQGVVASYIHNATAPDLGRIGVLVALESAGDKAKLRVLGCLFVLHVAATQPLSLTTDDLDPAAVERERASFAEQAAESGKPPAVVEKMVEGRIRKFFEEVVLTKQAFVMNPDQTIEQLVEATGKELGSPIKLIGFTRLALGEGVEKKSEAFAAEVAAAAAGASATRRK